MDRLRKIITPESLVIEKTALELAANFWEIGKSQGLQSKYKDARSYAKRYVEKFIPAAVSILMDMLGKDHIPSDQKDMIYAAFLERSNDKDLANTIPIFDNPLAKTFVSDKVIPQSPLIGTSPTYPAKKKKHKGRIEDLPLDNMLHQKGHLNG